MNETGSGRSGLQKVLIGCGFGCAGLLIAGLMLFGVGAFWVFNPGQQVSTDRIVGPESVGIVRLNELADDPGTQELLTTALETADTFNRRHQESLLPDSMKWLTALRRSPSANDLNRWIPREITVAFERADPAGQDPHAVVAVNLRTMIRPVKAALALFDRSDEVPQDFHSEHRGQDVYRLEGDDGFLGFVENTLLYSGNRDALVGAVDRVLDSNGEEAALAERAGREIPEGTWDVVGILENENGFVVDLLRDVFDEDLFSTRSLSGEALPFVVPGTEDAPLELRFGLDVVSKDEITAKVVLDASTAEIAAAWLAILDENLAPLRERAEGWGLELELESGLADRRVEADLHLLGLGDALAGIIEVEEGESGP